MIKGQDAKTNEISLFIRFIIDTKHQISIDDEWLKQRNLSYLDFFMACWEKVNFIYPILFGFICMLFLYSYNQIVAIIIRKVWPDWSYFLVHCKQQIFTIVIEWK